MSKNKAIEYIKRAKEQLSYDLNTIETKVSKQYESR